MKTKNGQEHDLKFKGLTTEEDGKSFVFWLAKHLHRNFGISIQELAIQGAQNILSQLERKSVWPWNKVAMSFKFR